MNFKNTVPNNIITALTKENVSHCGYEFKLIYNKISPVLKKTFVNMNLPISKSFTLNHRNRNNPRKRGWIFEGSFQIRGKIFYVLFVINMGTWISMVHTSHTWSWIYLDDWDTSKTIKYRYNSRLLSWKFDLILSNERLSLFKNTFIIVENVFYENIFRKMVSEIWKKVYYFMQEAHNSCFFFCIKHFKYFQSF